MADNIEIPGYKIIRTLGRGGMAAVYLAIQESFEREVALKVMNASLAADERFTERFLREAKIVSRLIHPNIVTVYDVGVHENLHFLSMEYIPGEDLKNKRRKLSLAERLGVVKEIAQALDYAGRKGYVHRDVKPENIMLHEENGRAVLMDFGIACMADTASGMTQTGTAIGTPHYMSPEQAKGRPVDARADIYSLGVVMFLLLVGYVPFDADSAVAVGIKHVSDPIPRLPKHLQLLQPIIDKVLAKDPNQRYQTGADFIAALDEITEKDLAAMEALGARFDSLRSDALRLGAATSESQRVSATRTPVESPDKTTLAANAVATGPMDRIRQQEVARHELGRHSPVAPESPRKVTRVVGAADENIASRSRSGPQPRSNTPISAKSGPVNTGRQGTDRFNRDFRADSTNNFNNAGFSGRHGNSEELLAIDEEDRRRNQVPPRPVWPWGIAAVALIVVASIGLRDVLPAPMQRVVDAGLDQGRSLRSQLYQAMGVEAVAPSTEVLVLDPPLLPVDATSQGGASTAANSNTPAVVTDSGLVEDGAGAADPNSVVRPFPIIPNQSTASPDEPGGQAAVNSPALVQALDGSAPESTAATPIERARLLREQLTRDITVAPELARIYRDLLANSPGNADAEQGLRELRDYYYHYIAEAVQARDLAKTQLLMDSIAASFPDIASDERYVAYMQRFAQARDAQVHIDRGNEFMVANALSSPAGANALESFQAALAVDPGNPKAEAGIERITNRYIALTEEHSHKEDYAGALEMARRGLAIAPAHPELMKLEKEALGQLDQRAKLANLRSTAEARMRAGDLITPRGESAFDAYQALAALSGGRTIAANGMVDIEKRLSRDIEALINMGNYSDARNALFAARESFPTSDRLLALEVSLDQAIEADYLARQPKVPQILVSNTMPEDIYVKQEPALAVDRTIHIGFSYDNFSTETSVVQAKLYDGGRNVEIAQVPVIVSGKQGVKFFTIDRPVEGFPAGGYHIDLHLNGEKLTSLPFRVERMPAVSVIN